MVTPGKGAGRDCRGQSIISLSGKIERLQKANHFKNYMNTTIDFTVGTENFQELVEDSSCYIDKTSWLREIFMGTKKDKALLFIRPRHFGKTLNMSMIKSFCQLNYENPGDKSYQENLFLDSRRNLAIAGEEYKELRNNFMGNFPVVYFSFKGIEGDNFQEALQAFLSSIVELYREFNFLKDSRKIPEYDKKGFINDVIFCRNYDDISDKKFVFKAKNIASNFISNLASMLYCKYGRKIIILLDEYDVPLQKASVAKEPYYHEMLGIIRQITVRTFRQNADPWLLKGIVTGCLNAHQSIFTDANNFTIYGMDDTPYAGFFGFTEAETENLLMSCDLGSLKDSVEEWYDGYRIGSERIFCPWSVMQFCAAARVSKKTSTFSPQPYWVNTSGNDIIFLYLQRAIAEDIRDEIDRMQALLDGTPQEVILRDFSTYPDVGNVGVDFDTFMTLLLHIGYVTYTDDSPFRGTVRLTIPNYEVLQGFRQKISLVYDRSNPVWIRKVRALLAHLLQNEWEEVRDLLDELFGEFLSIRDTGAEPTCHGVLLGMLAMVTNSHIELSSGTESCDGYADITLSNGRRKQLSSWNSKRPGTPTMPV